MSKFGTVRVEGSSMEPTYASGDWLLVHWLPLSPHQGRLGSIVVIEREQQPGILLIKRVQKSHGGNFWVEGDNIESTDSRSWGWLTPNEIVGQVLFRVRKKKSA